METNLSREIIDEIPTIDEDSLTQWNQKLIVCMRGMAPNDAAHFFGQITEAISKTKSPIVKKNRWRVIFLVRLAFMRCIHDQSEDIQLAVEIYDRVINSEYCTIDDRFNLSLLHSDFFHRIGCTHRAKAVLRSLTLYCKHLRLTKHNQLMIDRRIRSLERNVN